MVVLQRRGLDFLMLPQRNYNQIILDKATGLNLQQQGLESIVTYSSLVHELLAVNTISKAISLYFTVKLKSILKRRI